MSHTAVSTRNAVLVLLAICILPTAQTLAESVLIKRKFDPAHKSYIESRTEVGQDISGLPWPPMKLHSTELYGLWEKVESVADGKTKIVLTYDRAARDVESPMVGVIEFDTDDPENEEAAPEFRSILTPMIGMSMTLKVSKKGKAVSFTGLDAINKKISASAIASMQWEQMKDDFTDQRGKETWGEGLLRIYPNKKVKVGDTWQVSSSIVRPRIGTIVTEYQYKVDRIGKEDGRKVVMISYTAKVSKGPDAEPEADAKGRSSGKEEPKKGDTKKHRAKEDDAGKDNADKDSAKKKDAEKNGGKQDDAKKGSGLKSEISGSLSGKATYDVELGRMVRRSTEGLVNIKIPLSKLIPDMPAGEKPRFAVIKTTIKRTTSILTEKERATQKAEAHEKAELRKKAEEDEDEEDEDD